MRVLHLYAGNLYGGVEAMLATLARTAAGTGLEHAFALSFEGRLAEELRAAGAAPAMLGEVRLSRPWTALAARRALRRHLRASPADVAICHSAWSLAAFGPAVRAAGIPLVFWLHDRVRDLDSPGPPDRVDRAARGVRPDLAVCTSAYARESLPHLFPDVPSVVIHPPVLPRAVPSAAAARAELRREQSTPEEDVVIVQVGRMEAWKGQGALVDALVEMRDEPGWTCWFVGGAQRPEEWEYYAWLVGFATRGGVWERIRFLGPRDDVPHVLAAADVFCNPNSGEPFGVAMVEALYAGLPVVSFDAGGALEVVDAGCGLLAPAGATVRLADELRRVVDDPALRARLGAAGPARAAALSDPAAQAARLREALAGLVGGGAA